jgi:hypothetical protein
MKTMPSFSNARISLPEVSSRRHRSRFLFDDQSSKSAFPKLPGRWHQLIDNLCTNLGKETPDTRGFRINMDRTMREAEARASQSAAIPADETPEQRRRKFQEELHEVLRVCQDRGSSNKNVWAEALHLLDNPWVRDSNVNGHEPKGLIEERHHPFTNTSRSASISQGSVADPHPITDAKEGSRRGRFESWPCQNA